MRRNQGQKLHRRRVFTFEVIKDLLTSTLKEIIPRSNLTIKFIGNAIAAGTAQRISSWLVPGTDSNHLDMLEGLSKVEEAMIASILTGS